MKSKKSFFKSVVIKQDIRQHGWIGIVYFLLLLFAIPLEILQLADREYVIFSDYRNYFLLNPSMQVLILFSLPIAAGVLLFRYLQTEAAVDMTHSLPIRRATLYYSHLISGLLLLLIPLLLTSFITFFVTRSVEELTGILTITDLVSWTLLFMLLTCFLFVITTTVGMITGMSTAQAILTYIFLFLPLGVVTLVNYNLSFLLFGYSSSITEETTGNLSPFFRFIGTYGQFNPYTGFEIIAYTILTILLILIGLGLYKARQLEKATEVITFPFITPIFKYGVTFCSMTLGGSYFSATATLNWNWIVFGYIVGALIGYTAAEMILQKTWRIFQMKAFIGFAVYSVIFFVILLSISADLFQYESKLPKMDQIDEVYFGDKYAVEDAGTNNELQFSDSKLYIQDVRNLHEYILDEKEVIEDIVSDDINYMQGILIYKLKNGRTIKREYQIPIDMMNKVLTPILEAKDYQITRPEFLQLQSKEDPINIRIFPNAPGLNAVTISSKEDIESFKAAIEKDISSQTVDSLFYSTSSLGYIELSYGQNVENTTNMEHQYMDTVNIEWKKSYAAISKWLEDHEYLEDLTISEEDITKIELMRQPIPTDNSNKFEKDSPEEIFHTEGTISENVLTISNKELFPSIINNFVDYTNVQSYYLKLTLKNGQNWYGFIEETHLPEEIKNEL
ncbi:hypothetical protein [Metabacillus litoralis]|uniref:hypothetical protein n=1 Tax=Metabacillus litoralis TaxID=152268 RepID=UPI001CFD7D9C|nr:hypothetical protein [Metabacillus litoralis]